MKPGAITFKPIGVIHSDHHDKKKTPIQHACAEGCLGRAEIFPEFAGGLDGIEDFSHLYLLCHFDRQEGECPLTVHPPLRDRDCGVFATRSPNRPNCIGLTLAKLVRREGNVLFLDRVDILDGTPILDVKPYSMRFDRIESPRNEACAGALGDEHIQRFGRRENVE